MNPNNTTNQFNTHKIVHYQHTSNEETYIYQYCSLQNTTIGEKRIFTR